MMNTTQNIIDSLGYAASHITSTNIMDGCGFVASHVTPANIMDGLGYAAGYVTSTNVFDASGRALCYVTPTIVEEIVTDQFLGSSCRGNPRGHLLLATYFVLGLAFLRACCKSVFSGRTIEQQSSSAKHDLVKEFIEKNY
ncbi:MAG: hypothetical protein K1000chlam2_01023 [Chlamydiae bacterium]|nr:hypothetical protein [Chlamydiota bacterium]